MWVTLLLSLAAACEMPSLPNSLDALEPAFAITREADVYGKYLVSDAEISWTLDVKVESWLR
jgi:hypothetical protein